MSGGKFLKEWQVRDKIKEWFFFPIHIQPCKKWLKNDKWQIKLLSQFLSQFAFNHLQMTQTQKIITCRVSKIHKWIWGHVYEWGKVSKPWQVRDKII